MTNTALIALLASTAKTSLLLGDGERYFEWSDSTREELAIEVGTEDGSTQLELSVTEVAELVELLASGPEAWIADDGRTLDWSQVDEMLTSTLVVTDGAEEVSMELSADELGTLTQHLAIWLLSVQS